MDYILENWGLIVLGLYLLATAVAMVTPSDKDNTILDKVGAFADACGAKLKGQGNLIEVIGKLIKRKK